MTLCKAAQIRPLHTREAAQAEWANPKREGKPLPCDTPKTVTNAQLPRARRSYDGCMKYTKCFCFLMAVILPATTALAQTSERWPSDESATSDDVAAARRPYTQNADRQGDNKGNTLAQVGRRGGPPFSAHGGYPRREGYASPRAGHPNAGHLLIGAAIGFGIGATLVGINSARNGTPVGGGVILGGSLFGFIGGAFGSAIGGSHTFAHRGRFYLPSVPEEEQADRGSESQVSHAGERSSGEPVSSRLTLPSQPVVAEAGDQPLRRMATVP